MIAFYAVSNIAVINAINVKETHFAREDADLYIRFVNGTSIALVKAIMNLNIFSNVYTINFPTFNKKAGILGRIQYLRVLSYGKKIQRFVDRYLDIMAEDKIYSIMFTLHMDAHAVYFANYFRKKNKHIEIRFYEDGTASYLCTKKYLTHPIQHTMSTREFIAKKIYEAYYYFHVKSNITNQMYVYSPKNCNPKNGFSPQPILMQPVCLALLKQLSEEIELGVYARYKKKVVYYLANAKTKAEPTYTDAYTIIDRILKVVGDNPLIIKTHSNASTENRDAFGKQYENHVFVDRNVYLFESIMAELQDLNQKIIISRASTASFLPKIWFDKEPYIILTFRLFPYYGEMGDPGGDEYVKLLKGSYSDPSRIMIPNTLAEMEIMLDQCLSIIYDNIY